MTSFSRFASKQDVDSQVFIEAFRIRSRIDDKLEGALLRKIVLKDFEVPLAASLRGTDNMDGVDPSFTTGEVDLLLCPAGFLRWSKRLDDIRMDQNSFGFRVYQNSLRIMVLITIFATTTGFAFDRYCASSPNYVTTQIVCATISLVYLVLALPGRLLWTWISLEDRKEYTTTKDIIFLFAQTSRFWLDLISVSMLFLEFQKPVVFPDYGASGTPSSYVMEDWPVSQEVLRLSLVFLRGGRLMLGNEFASYV